MRDLMFRGKDIRHGRWIVSDSIRQEDGKVYLYDEIKDIDVEVDAATVGEYTGMVDKNGVNIFEGDIIRCTYEVAGVDFEKMGLFTVVFTDGWFMKRKGGILHYFVPSDARAIVGNIFDDGYLL